MMWSHQELNDKESWRTNDIAPDIRALLGPELDCIADDTQLDRGLILHLAHEAIYEWPAPETSEWVQAAIKANPGITIAQLCRAMHSREEGFRSIAYCGQCRVYANPRRRARAAALQSTVLPGFEEIGGNYHLHRPCSRRDLTWLRHQVYRLVRLGLVDKRREKRPDIRQARGYDFMSALYPVE